ncbi:YafY family protein [Roseovarius sp. M141]|uniref:helix-turn-helix transcriptional regulator n=1 Tax=Roseovarius sp. M141 TaxID=2583806 RepID=UPI0020CCE59C|nr:YafY family protein [Roseovarius sp. M141]MCQ0090231.1 YafY family transcriptional regulator [Roseovarius sp. M141]
MPRSTRLFEIIQILRHADGPVTAQEIGDALEVAKRTIYRDIAALQAMRLPIDGEAGIGYVMQPGYDLPPLMFTQDEMEAIVVGLALLGRIGDRGLERAARHATTKISDVLPDAGTRTAPLRVSKWNNIPNPKIEASALRKFIRDNAELTITYVDLKDRRTTRDIKPIALIYYIDAVLLAAWCELRQAFRHFRIDRIEDCSPSGRNFCDLSETLVKGWEHENKLP